MKINYPVLRHIINKGKTKTFRKTSRNLEVEDALPDRL